MSALYDQAKLNTHGTQRVELYEDGALWLIDEEKRIELKLEAVAATNLLAFLSQWGKIYEEEHKLQQEACTAITAWARAHFFEHVIKPDVRIVSIQHDEEKNEWTAELEVATSGDNPTVTFSLDEIHGLRVSAVE